MKKNILLFIAFTISIGSFSQKRNVIKPSIKKSAVAILYGKKKTYYHLNKSLEFPVDGLKKVVLYTRERLLKETNGYTINYKFDNDEEKLFLIEKSKIDKKSAYTSKSIQYRTSKRFKQVIEVPKNAKILYISSTNKLIDVYIKEYKKKKSIKPIQGKRVKILTGKTAYYYRLNSKIATNIHIKEAGKLYVYTRKRLGKKDNRNYTFSYNKEKDNPINIKVENTKISKYSIYKSLKNKRKPSIYHKTIINVKENSEFTFSSLERVDARFVFVKEWNEIFKKKANRVDLITKKGNKTRPYFRVSPNKDFNFKVKTKNNTKGKIFIRGEFTYDMLSNNDYKIILKDFGKVVTTYKLTCHRSKEMNYKNNADNIPGTLDKIFFDIPKGNHQYSISIGNKHKTALVRVLIKN